MLCNYFWRNTLTAKFHCLTHNMPKSNVGKTKLRVVRYKEQCGGKLPIPSQIQLVVLGTGTKGSPRSVMLLTDHYRYLFNCGESVQRIASEFRHKLTRVQNLFFTTKSWENLGGLLGTVLTLQSKSIPTIHLHGPHQAQSLVRTFRTFNYDSKIQIEMKSHSGGFYQDDALRVDYVMLESDKPTTQISVTEAAFRDDSPHGSPEIQKRMRRDYTDNLVVAYLVTPFPKPRTLCLEKCVELGVPVGPILSILKREESVTLENGTVIHPDQVLSPPETTSTILFVECPTEDYLTSLTTHPKLQHFLEVKDSDTSRIANQCETTAHMELVVHMTPEHITCTEQYQAWMSGFGSETRHLILNESASSLSHEGIYSLQTVLNLIDPKIFPLLPPQLKMDSVKSDLSGNIQKGFTNLRYSYRPKDHFVCHNYINLNNQSAVDEVLVIPGVSEAIVELKEKVATRRNEISRETAGCFPRMLFLGTGSSQPSKVRNVSAILVDVNESTSVLFDCGEGTLAQLHRNFDDETNDILCKIKAVFISHMHADHHLGMVSVACARFDARKKAGLPEDKLLLLAPVQITKWLKYFTNNILPLEHILRLVPLQEIQQSRNESISMRDILKSTDLSSIKVVEVRHCHNAFGFVIGSYDWAITYSGDTMPCDALIEAGQGCDVLIHEATMEDELETEAKERRHSTTSQAIDVGQRMKAKYTILTHFSQRYAKIPVFDDKFSANVGVAFDNMRVSLNEVPLLPLFIPALKVMFHEEHSELQARTAQYVRKHRDLLMTKDEEEQLFGSVT